jgi:RNA polymerase sigma-70 factor (ECF subfamily)
MFLAAEAEGCGLTLAEFGEVLSVVGAKCNFGQPSAVVPDPRQCAAFVRGLRLADLALAHACALGRESAWKRFLDLYRASLTKAAIAITRSATLGEELADSLYAELYGLRQTAPEDAGGAGGRLRRSPLASYSGRGSLMGWLRTTLAQRHVDLHRRTRRETPLADFDAPAPQTAPAPLPAHLLYLKHALTQTIRSLSPEDRFLLSAYFLDQRTLLEIGRILHVHEATVSRRIKRLAADLREELLLNLRLGGMNMRAAEEVLGIDPRDLEINLHWLLQTSQASPFQEEAALQTEAKQAETGQS